MTAYTIHMTNGKKIRVVTEGPSRMKYDLTSGNRWLEVCTGRGKWCYINTANIAYVEGGKE